MMAMALITPPKPQAESAPEIGGIVMPGLRALCRECEDIRLGDRLE
jgi:hypothetical protein